MGDAGVNAGDAALLLRAGALAIVPTDTVYGIACAAPDADACRRLYELKSRPADQPTAVVFASVEQALEGVSLAGDTRVQALCRLVFPGPVTLVLPNPDRRFAHVCGASPERIGVRVPQLQREVAALAAAAGGLVATSANLRGEPAPARLSDVPAELIDECAVVMDGGELPGAPSSVIDVTGPRPRVLREGPEVAGLVERLSEA